MTPDYQHRLRIEAGERTVALHAALTDAREWITTHRRSEPRGAAIMRNLLTTLRRYELREQRRSAR